MFPTPDAGVFNLTTDPETNDARRERMKAKDYNGNGAGLTLAQAVQMYPTSTASSGGDNNQSPAVTERGHGRNLAGFVRYQTPTVDDANQGAGGRISGDFKSLTRQVIHGSRTPIARDTPSVGTPTDAPTRTIASLLLEGFEIPAAPTKALPTPAARDYRSPNSKPYSERGGGTKGEQLPNAVGGSLSPTWVELLMGFPPGWTAAMMFFSRKRGRKS